MFRISGWKRQRKDRYALSISVIQNGNKMRIILSFDRRTNISRVRFADDRTITVARFSIQSVSQYNDRFATPGLFVGQLLERVFQRVIERSLDLAGLQRDAVCLSDMAKMHL